MRTACLGFGFASNLPAQVAPRNPPGRRRLGLLAGLLAGVFALHLAAGLTALGAADPVVERGLGALQKRAFPEAVAAFDDALATVRTTGDTNRQADLLFYRGVAKQQSALAAGASDVEPSRRFWREAAEDYRAALVLRPNSPALWNNLAQSQLRLGMTNEAMASFQAAIQHPDPKRAFYTQNYADLLLSLGKWRDACRFYALVVAEQPQNRAVQQKILDLCLERDRDLLLYYLWQQAKAGQVTQARDHALDLLRRTDWKAPQQEELMGLVALCLSEQTETRAEFASSPTASRLQELRGPPVLEACARELLQVYDREGLDPGKYRWWPRLVRPEMDAPRGMWPLEAMQQLLRSLAERSRTAGEPALEEQYLRLAVEMNPRATDPEALTRLARLYAARGQEDRLRQLMQRHEAAFLQGKGDAYRASQAGKIYKYHLSLGLIYSELGRWTNSGRIDSATFQLERALSFADDLSRAEPNAEVRISQVPPQLVNLLAKAYEKSGRNDDALGLRVDRAQSYLGLNDAEAARQVFEPAREARIPPTWSREKRDRFNACKTGVPLRPNAGIGPARSPGGVTVGDSARILVGAGNYQRLGTEEVNRLQQSVTLAVDSLGTNATPGSPLAEYQLLPAKGLAPDVQEILLQGQQGQVLLRKGTNLLKVPFTVGGKPSPRKNVRLVRP